MGKKRLCLRQEQQANPLPGERRLCWCLTGGVWKALHEVLHFPTDTPWNAAGEAGTACLWVGPVCWCLTGGVWKALHEVLHFPTDTPWNTYNEPSETTDTEFSKEQTEIPILTFRHLASHVPTFEIIDTISKAFPDADPAVALSNDPSDDHCHTRLTSFNDDYNINQENILLLLDKAIADISGLLHQQQNLPAHDFRPLVIFHHSNQPGQELTFLGTLSNHPRAPVTELLSAFSKQRGQDIKLEPGDQLRIDIYPTLR